MILFQVVLLIVVALKGCRKASKKYRSVSWYVMIFLNPLKEQSVIKESKVAE